MVFVKRTYTAEQVKLALRVYHSVQSFRRASANTGIPKSTIHRWTCRLGRVIDWNKTKKRRITRCNARFDSCHQVLLDLLRGCPFKPLKTLQCELHARNINLSISTLHRYIRTLNYTYQKISWRKPPRDVSCEKKSFWRELRSVLNEGRNVLSVDEAGFLTNDLPLRGYGLRGQRLCAVNSILNGSKRPRSWPSVGSRHLYRTPSLEMSTAPSFEDLCSMCLHRHRPVPLPSSTISAFTNRPKSKLWPTGMVSVSCSLHPILQSVIPSKTTSPFSRMEQEEKQRYTFSTHRTTLLIW